MPTVDIVFYAEADGRSPAFEWLVELRQSDPAGWANVRARIRLLAEQGHELRRPAADFLRDSIYELRAKRGRIQYRLLYFFSGKSLVVLVHGLQKPGASVPLADIERALQRKRRYESDPRGHTYEGEKEDGKNTERT